MRLTGIETDDHSDKGVECFAIEDKEPEKTDDITRRTRLHIWKGNATRTGHVALETFSGDHSKLETKSDDGIYASFYPRNEKGWPHKFLLSLLFVPQTPLHCTEGDDIETHQTDHKHTNGLPDIILDIDGLDIDAINEAYCEFRKRKASWAIFSLLLDPHKYQNCSSLVLALLEAGGIEKEFPDYRSSLGKNSLRTGGKRGAVFGAPLLLIAGLAASVYSFYRLTNDLLKTQEGIKFSVATKEKFEHSTFFSPPPLQNYDMFLKILLAGLDKQKASLHSERNELVLKAIPKTMLYSLAGLLVGGGLLGISWYLVNKRGVVTPNQIALLAKEVKRKQSFAEYQFIINASKKRTTHHGQYIEWPDETEERVVSRSDSLSTKMTMGNISS